MHRKLCYKADFLRYTRDLRIVSERNDSGDCWPHGLGICVIVKNEGKYIGEWLRYHMAIGADVVYLYDNDSDDDTRDVIKPFIDEGFVSYTHIPGHGRQLDAYNDALRRHRFDCKYIAFIDADEFIFKIDRDEGLVDTIDSIMSLDPNAGGVAVNWRMFGSSGYEQKPRGGVLESFVWRAEEDGAGNQCIKTIVNPRRAFEFHHVHYPKYFRPYYSIAETGERVDDWQYHNTDIKRLRINHYFTKSKEEWIERRSLGMADFTDRKRSLDEFYAHDNNDVFDDSALYWVERMRGD